MLDGKRENAELPENGPSRHIPVQKHDTAHCTSCRVEPPAVVFVPIQAGWE